MLSLGRPQNRKINVPQNKIPQRHLTAYLYDYLITEVQLEASIRKRDTFARFIDILGFCQGELINFTNIARDCGVDAKTVRSYFEILEDMYIGYFVRPFKTRSKRQHIQLTPKFYLFDTGIASYLRKYHFQELAGSEAGKAFEHYIFLELMAYKLLNHKRDEVMFWRDKDGYEVDFVVQDIAIEVKISSAINKRELRGLLKLHDEHPCTLHVVSNEYRKRVITIDGCTITIWPVEAFLSTLWVHQFWL